MLTRSSFLLSTVPTTLFGRSQVDATEKQHELFARQLEERRSGFRPLERALLEALRADPQPAAIEVEDLQAIASAIREDKEMTRKKIEFELAENNRSQTVEAEPHVRRSRDDEDTR